MITIDEAIVAKVQAEDEIRKILQKLNKDFNVSIDGVVLLSMKLDEINNNKSGHECNREIYEVTLEISL